MTPFNPENKDILTYGESLEPAMSITDPEDARQYFEALVTYTAAQMSEPYRKGQTPAEVARQNLGYFAGYYSHETRLRVQKLFGAEHPLLGPARATPPAPEEVFAEGQRYGELSTQFDNLGRDEDGNWIGNCRYCETHGVLAGKHARECPQPQSL